MNKNSLILSLVALQIELIAQSGTQKYSTIIVVCKNHFVQITREEYREREGSGADCHDVSSAFEFLVRVDQKCDVQATKELRSGIRSLDSWLSFNEEKLRKLFVE